MGRAQRLTAKGKFHVNCYGQLQSSDRPTKKVRPQSCASSSKIDLNGSFEATADNDSVLGYRLVDVRILFGFLKEHLVCAHCDSHASLCISGLVESRWCLHGRTQNANDALNEMIWARCPKTTFGSFKTVQTVVDDAIKVLKQLGATPGPLCVSTLTSIDSKRKRKSELQAYR